MTDDFDDLLGPAPTAGEHNLSLALKLASQGFPVFPCRHDAEEIKGKLYKEKSPHTRGGFKDATTKVDQIKRWWAKWPNALVGMPTGAASGFAVIDLDRHAGKADGVAAFKALGFDPKGVTPLRVKTAGNGIHLLFKWREGITNSDRHLPEGVDVRAEGGFIIAPGSRFADGRAWSEVNLLQAAPEYPEALMPPEREDVTTGETGDSHRIDLTLEQIQDYLDDLPNDEAVTRHDWIAIMASLHHEATAPNEEGEFRTKAEQNAICKMAVEWTARNPAYASDVHKRQAKQDFWSFRDSPHKKLATFRSIAKTVLMIRREQEMDEALSEFEDEDDLGAPTTGSKDADFDDDFEEQDEDDDLLGTPAPKAEKKAKKKRPEVWEDPSAPKYIQLMNKRHAIVRFNSKTYIVDFIARDEGDDPFTFGDEKSLHMFYAPNTIETKVVDDSGKEKIKEISWSHLWIKSPYRRFYDKGIVFDPKGDTKGALNLWRGFKVKPDAEAKCDLLIKHIEEIICSGNKKVAKVFLDFLAHIVQKPWERPTFSIVMKGEMGAGKDTPFRFMQKILGSSYITVGRNADISGRFNSHMMGKVLVHLQEGFFAGDRQQQNYMKFLLDSPTINIERKGVDSFTTKAYHRTVISSNEEWVAPVGWGERRYLVLDVDNRYAYGDSEEQQAKNKAYFEKINHQMNEGGGLEGFMHFLMSRDISDFDIRRPPKTDGQAKQLAEGLRDVDRWWKDCLDAGCIDQQDNSETPMRDIWERGWITKPFDDLFNAYEAWCRKQRFLGQPVTRNRMSRDLSSLCPALEKKNTRVNGRVVKAVHLPSLADCRAAMERRAGGKLDWADEIDSDLPPLDEHDDLG